eukprot:scaffold488849_cov31-Prasinocladus_malaysianus.AAC.1
MSAATALALFGALILTLFLGGANGHCACDCDCGPVTNIAAMGLLRTCIHEQVSAVGATNRTLQLLETIAEKSGAIRGCGLDMSALNASLAMTR